MAFKIITDSGCDFPASMYEELGLHMVPLSVLYKDRTITEYSDDFLKELYDGMRAEERASTSAINPEGWACAMEQYLSQGLDVLVLAFSSGLSTTYQSAVIAAEELKEKYPDRKIRVVDTLCASLGQGLLVWYAAKKQQEGLDVDQVADWAENNKLNLCHYFTPDDLMHLKRGGRVSAATAVAGTLLQIKPVLHVDNEGHLISIGKARGRKAALKALCDAMGDLALPGENETVFISHGDCLEDAQYLADMIKEKYSTKEVFISYIGAVIGAHAGPGTIALFFLGNHR